MYLKNVAKTGCVITFLNKSIALFASSKSCFIVRILPRTFCLRSSKNFLKWYFGHINVDEDYNHLTGTVYDYKVHIESGSIKEEYNEMTYDSADSYAAVFLTALWHYYKATDDKEFLIENKTYTDAVSYCLLSLISDGYTISKPDYSISYLMDNCEVYDGLRCAEKIIPSSCKISTP